MLINSHIITYTDLTQGGKPPKIILKHFSTLVDQIPVRYSGSVQFGPRKHILHHVIDAYFWQLKAVLPIYLTFLVDKRVSEHYPPQNREIIQKFLDVFTYWLMKSKVPFWNDITVPIGRNNHHLAPRDQLLNHWSMSNSPDSQLLKGIQENLTMMGLELDVLGPHSLIKEVHLPGIGTFHSKPAIICTYSLKIHRGAQLLAHYIFQLHPRSPLAEVEKYYSYGGNLIMY